MNGRWQKRWGRWTFCAAICVSIACAGQEVTTTAPQNGQERTVRLIVAFEVARRHAEVWESNPAAESLVREMMSDLADIAELKWSASFILKEREDDRKDDFEREAIQLLGQPSSRRPIAWTPDRARAVVAVTAKDSCVRCHATEAGQKIGYVSLKWNAGQSGSNVPKESRGP